MNRSIAVACSFCEEDLPWVPQFLAEMERLNLRFGMHFDRCSESTKLLVSEHPLCIVTTSQDNPRVEYNEQHKQAIFDGVSALAAKLGFNWVFHWDIDETLEKDGPRKLDELSQPEYLVHHLIKFHWVNLWEDPQHIRKDGAFAAGHRTKLYNVTNGKRWHFDHKITYGAKLVIGDPNVNRPDTDKTIPEFRYDLTILHWGFMTEALREMHKARWDRIYTTAVGNNPYGMWNYTCDRSIVPTILDNPYL